MGLYEDFIFTRTYARWIPELQRRETWEETVDRFCNFIFFDTPYCNLIPEKTKYKIKTFILQKEIMPSMRLLFSAGPNARRDNISAYNCSGLCMNDLRAFGEIMYILLSGAGVGYSVERKYTNQLPVIQKQRNLPPLRFTVPDTRLGWKQSVDFAIVELYSGRDVQFNFSEVRPAGTPLKISGGYSSGPEPLQRCLEFIRETIIKAQGRKLTSLEVSDICNEIAASVVCGGVRRSSEICLCDIEDDDMKHSKHGEHHPRRYMANISAVYRVQPSVLDFTQEFLDSYRSGSGERGIFNLVAARKLSPKRRDTKKIVVTNPCFRGDMRLLTEDGYLSFEELANYDSVNLVNANGNVVPGKVWCSGEKQIVEVRFFSKSSMQNIFCTPDHTFMLSDGSSCEAKDLAGKRLMPFISIKNTFDKDDFLAGFIQGDGCTNRLNSPTHRGLEVRFGEKDFDIAAMFNQTIGTWYSREAHDVATRFGLDSSVLPERKLPSVNVISPSFLSGLFSANGSVISGHRVNIKSTCYDMLLTLQHVLKDQFHIESYITTNKPTQVEFSNGTYLCKESYDLNISQYNSLLKFASLISFGQTYKQDSLRSLLLNRAPMVRSVKSAGVDYVYDFTEPEIHWGVVEGIVAHNCAETLLRDMGLCNLTEVIIRESDDFDTVQDKIKTCTWLGVIQSTLTYFPNLREEWSKNAEEERLLGVSLTGLADCANLITPETLVHWKRTAIKTAKKASNILGINMPAAITVLKPSGCRPWNGLVTTDKGIFTLEDLFTDHYKDSLWCDFKQPIKAITPDDSFSITKTYQNGVADTVKIKLAFGMELQSTPNHQWFVKERHINRRRVPIQDWVRADSLVPGDVLDVAVGVYNNPDHFKFAKVNSLSFRMRRDTTEIIQPDFMNEDIAWFLGYLWGDGAMSPNKYRIRFIDGRDNNLEKVQRILRDYFGVESTLHLASGHRKARTLDVGSKLLWHWLIKNNVWKYFNDSIDVIPQCVRSSSKSDIIAFIAGLLDADGWMGKQTTKGIDEKCITLTSASELLARHVQEVALAVGLVFGLSKNVGGSNLQKTKQMFLMSLAIGTLPESMAVLEKNSNKADELNKLLPGSEWRCVKDGGKGLTIGKVKGVEPGDVVPTYDIETSSHWFYAGAVKSHNTVSQMCGTSSGIHSRWAPYYIRRVRISTHDALFKMMVAQNMPYEMDKGNHDTAIFSFPIKSPQNCKTRNDDTALGQLEWYKMLVENWCEQNASATIYIKEEELLDVCSYVYKNFQSINGVSFFPFSNVKYEQPPYEEIDEFTYRRLAAAMPKIDFSKLSDYELKDETEAPRTVACAGGVCEL